MAEGSLFAKVRAESAELLKLDDVSDLTLAQQTKLNLVTTLRILTDDIQAKLVAGTASPGDLAKLQSASETLLGLLPTEKAHDLAPNREGESARQALATMLTNIARAEPDSPAAQAL